MLAMGERAENVSFSWVEEVKGQPYAPAKTKRKYMPKKKEFVGWGSRALTEFLQTIGIDANKQLSQYEVTDIINKYVDNNKLIHPGKKKRIVCDERLHSLFGRKTIGRIKIYNLLGSHFAENQEESDDDFFYSSEEKEDNGTTRQEHKPLASERKTHKKKVRKACKSSIAAIIPENIKLVYLKKSLVQDLLKDPETFEGKIVGSFVRIKSDPNDIYQKNYFQLVEVTGVKNASGTDGMSAEVLLQVTNSIRDIRICMLSDDNFSKEECEDLHQRMKNGLPKQPTVEELEQKMRILHEDITKHWLVRELASLRNLIDRANEKGWRKELFELLERRQLLQSTSEQSRLLHDIPEVIGEEIIEEAVPQDSKDDVQENNSSKKPMLDESSEIPIRDVAAKVTVSTWTSTKIDSAGTPASLLVSKPDCRVGTEADLMTFKQDNQMGIPDASLTSKQDSRMGTGANLMMFKQDNQKGNPAALPTSIPDNGEGTGANLMSFKQDSQIGTPATLLTPKQDTRVGTGADSIMFKPDSGIEHLPNVLAQQQQNPPPETITVRFRGMLPFKIEENKRSQAVPEKQAVPPQFKVEENKRSQATADKQPVPPQVIELSDDEETEDPNNRTHLPTYDPATPIWYYVDPTGSTQGPFPLTLLKLWSEANYFSPGFKIWKTGQTRNEASLLSEILHRSFPR